MSDARPICRLRIWTDDEEERRKGGETDFSVGGRRRERAPSAVGGQIDLGFPVCPYFQKEATVRGTEWR